MTEWRYVLDYMYWITKPSTQIHVLDVLYMYWITKYTNKESTFHKTATFT